MLSVGQGTISRNLIFPHPGAHLSDIRIPSNRHIKVLESDPALASMAISGVWPAIVEPEAGVKATSMGRG